MAISLYTATTSEYAGRVGADHESDWDTINAPGTNGRAQLTLSEEAVIFSIAHNVQAPMSQRRDSSVHPLAVGGKSIGKRLLKIRVVSVIHDRIFSWHSIERSLWYGASFLEGGLGFIQYFIHPNRQTVHDLIAETIIVSVRPSEGSRTL